jgi:hypothetical protein
VCFNGEPLERECASGLHWDPTLNNCIPRSISTCFVSSHIVLFILSVFINHSKVEILTDSRIKKINIYLFDRLKKNNKSTCAEILILISFHSPMIAYNILSVFPELNQCVAVNLELFSIQV